MVDRAIYIGANGAISQQFGIDVLSNNIANINTVGYRAQRATFSDLFSRVDRLGTEFANPIQSGHGSDLSSTDTLFGQGELKTSNTFSDVAIAGDGFFVLRDPRLPAVFRTFYTRAGNFGIDAGVATSGSGNPFTSGGQVIFLREQPTYSTLPRLVDPATGRIVQGYLADTDGVIQTTVTDLTIDPSTKDPAKETSAFSVTGSLDSTSPDYDTSVMKDSTSSQLASLTGEFNQNQDRGVLSVKWNSDGSGSWTFLKTGQTVPDPQNTVLFTAGTVKTNTTHSFIPGMLFRTQDLTNLKAGSFTSLIGPFDVKSNSSVITGIEGAYLGNKEDGTLSITTSSSGTVSWTFTPAGKKFIAESGTGTFATADSAITTIIPGITLRKPAGTALSTGTLVVETDHLDDTAGSISALFDDSSPNTQHTMIAVFKQIQQNQYGMMVTGQTQERFSDSSITTLSNGQKQISAYANIDPNQMTLKRTSDNATLSMAFSKVTADPSNNLQAASVRGAFWTTASDLSGTVSLTIDAAGGGSWSFTPVGQLTATATGTIASGTLRANTTYSLTNGNEVIPGLAFTTGSAISAGTVSLESTIGSYATYDNRIIFSPSFSTKVSTASSFLADYKFASNLFTNTSLTSGTNLYSGLVAFDATGQFDSTNSSVPTLTITPTSSTDTLSITPTVSTLVQFAGKSTADITSVDGNLEGLLTGLEFNEQGRLLGVFSNDKRKNMAQLVLATFRNPGGLNRVGDTSFQETTASGAATVRSIDEMTPGIAKIVPFELEYSNSRLEDELTDLIFFQRAFQFSSRAIRVADELVQNAIGLKRG